MEIVVLSFNYIVFSLIAQFISSRSLDIEILIYNKVMFRLRDNHLGLNVLETNISRHCSYLRTICFIIKYIEISVFV
jgi:hypothetical protein